MTDPGADPDVDLDPFAARPYALTGGRTKGRTHLDLISLVCIASRHHTPTITDLNHLHAETLRLCTEPVSVAEVAAQLTRPVTVTKVILSDLIELGLVIHKLPPDTKYSTDHEVLMKVLHGLRNMASEGSV